MRLLSLILQEAKQVGIVYHFTPYLNWESIKNRNTLIGQPIQQDLSMFYGGAVLGNPEERERMFRSKKKHTPIEGYYISTTRNKMLYRNTGLLNDLNAGESYPDDLRIIRITLDGTKLSNRYKIIPYNYFSDLGKAKIKDKQLLDEYEERIILPENNRQIQNIKSYILQVDLLVFKNAYDKFPEITLNFENI